MITGTATIGVDRDLADRNRADQDRYHDRNRDLANLDRADFDRDLAFVCPDLMIFLWVLFVFWGINDIMYSFGNRENVRKCEQQVKNVFSMVFSRTQPNIKKYFPKCNKTHENIFFSRK